MPTRFDHAVIGVHDLERGLERFQHLGFDAQPGGRHADGGTHNGLIRFGLDYIELISVYDEALARARGRTITDELGGQEGALIGYALATESVEEEASRFHGTEPDLPYPRAMGRNRPNGQALTWRVLAPGDTSWRRPWPFLIQWDTPDEERLKIDLPGKHANGAIAWKHISVAVNDLESASDVYRNQLGLELVKEDVCPLRVARRATFKLGAGTIEVLAPSGDGLIKQVLAEKGEGPYALAITVKNLDQTRAFLTARKIQFLEQTARIALAQGEAFAVHLSFVE